MNNILKNLNAKGSFYKFNGIVSCVRENCVKEEVISRLKDLKSDVSRIAGLTISDFAIAALDVLNVEKYKGNNEEITALIKRKFDF